MARVESLNTNVYSPYSVFNSMGKGVVIGGVAGYAAKYMLPLSEAEKDNEYKIVTNDIKRQAGRSKGIPIEAIRNLETRTPAQDVFLKMVDAGVDTYLADEKATLEGLADSAKGKSGTKTLKDNIASIRRSLKMNRIIKEANLDADGIKELKNIIAQVNEKARVNTEYFLKSYDSATKAMKRPTIAFVTMGAVAGFFGGLIHNVINGQNA